jgi:broad specificity phosphatase PhoE
MRHFKVKDGCDKRYFNSKEIDIWVDRYDEFPLKTKDLTLPQIDKTYTSDLDRAKRSADHLKLTYESNKLLNEVSTKAFIDTNLKFPKLIWLIVGRILWNIGAIKKSETKKQTYKRANDAAQFLISSDAQNILVISHGFFMKALKQELELRGFIGEMDTAPRNGVVYRFSK